MMIMMGDGDGDGDGDFSVRQCGGGDHPATSRRPRHLNPGTGPSALCNDNNVQKQWTEGRVVICFSPKPLHWSLIKIY